LGEETLDEGEPVLAEEELARDIMPQSFDCSPRASLSRGHEARGGLAPPNPSRNP
jgi:hypothetical protein